jgi:protein SCO1/2
MRRHPVLFLCALALVAGACGRHSDERTYTLQGQVLALNPAGKTVTVKHEAITGFMPAMTMPYDVADVRTLDGLAPGDLINATLVVFANGAHLTAVRKVGSAPLEKPPADTAMPTASSGFELLKPGEAVPNASFLDQDGRKRQFADYKGQRVILTFIYTECPLPTFCPLMDRRFAAMQKPLADDPSMRDVRLLTVSFDPLTDTPPVLKAHARRLNADPARWTFLTGDRDEVDRFASRFGVQVSRALNDQRDITHNLRTVVIDRDGRLSKVYTGNDWTPEQVLGDVKAAAATAP